METDLLEQTDIIFEQSLLIDPKVEMNKAKKAGQMETLIDYDEITKIIEQAK